MDYIINTKQVKIRVIDTMGVEWWHQDCVSKYLLVGRGSISWLVAEWVVGACMPASQYCYGGCFYCPCEDNLSNEVDCICFYSYTRSCGGCYIGIE